VVQHSASRGPSLAHSPPPPSTLSRKSTPFITWAPPWTAKSPLTNFANSSCSVSGTHAHHKLAVAITCPRSPLRNGPATTIYNLWRVSVAVHALMHLVPLHSHRHLTQLHNPQPIPRLHCTYTFRINVTEVPYLCLDLGFPPLDLQTAVALVRLHCRLHHLTPTSLSQRLFRLRISYPSSPSSLEAAMQSVHAQLLQPHLWPSFTLPPRLARVTKPKNIERAYARAPRPTVSAL